MTQSPKLIAAVVLQSLDSRRKNFETLAMVSIDVSDLLARPVDEVRRAIRDFEGDAAPYLELLGTFEAEALSAAHGGPTEVTLDITGFLDDLGILPPAATAGSLDWLTEELLEKARAATGITARAPGAGDGQIFGIGSEHALVVHDGSIWVHRGSFGSKADAEGALGALSSPPGPR